MFHTEDTALVGQMDAAAPAVDLFSVAATSNHQCMQARMEWSALSGILRGMRVVEGSAFVAVPLAGMTLAANGGRCHPF